MFSLLHSGIYHVQSSSQWCLPCSVFFPVLFALFAFPVLVAIFSLLHSHICHTLTGTSCTSWNAVFGLLLPQEWVGARGHADHVPVPDHLPLPNIHEPGAPEWEPDKATGAGAIPVLQVSWLSFDVWITVHRNYLHSTCSQADVEKHWAVKYTAQIVSVPSCAACWYSFLLFDFSTGWIHWRLCTNSWKVSSPSFSSSPLVHLPVNPESLMLTRIWCWQEGRYRISCFWC